MSTSSKNNATDKTLSVELEKLKACIHCGMCLPSCPTYGITGSEAESPRGRLYLMKSLLQPDKTGTELSVQAVQPHLDQCLGCLSCQTTCPSGVQYGELLTASREVIRQQESFNILRWVKRLIFQYLLPYRQRLNKLAWFLKIYQQSGIQELLRKLHLFTLLPFIAHQESLLPTVPKQYKSLNRDMVFGSESGIPVVLFVGCVMDTFYNPVHWDTIQVMVANGYRVFIGEQTCCGALAHHAGERDIVTSLAQKNVAAILKNNPRYIIINSAGCGSTLKEYSHLLNTDEAASFSEKVVDIMTLLSQKPLALKAGEDDLPLKVTYHAACHLHHAQGVHTEPLSVLEQLPNVQLQPLKDASMCCGSAGIYNLEHPDLSEPILDEKISHVLNTKADVLVTGNPGCLLQIEKGLREVGSTIQLMHPVSLIARYTEALKFD